MAIAIKMVHAISVKNINSTILINVSISARIKPFVKDFAMFSLFDSEPVEA